MLLKAGSSQPACEQALLEASIHGRARFVEVLMGSDLIRPHVALHAFVTACGRGFTDVVDTMMKVRNKLIHHHIYPIPYMAYIDFFGIYLVLALGFK